MDAHDERTVETLDRLINTRRAFRRAYNVGTRIYWLDSQNDRDTSAHVLFRIALAATLLDYESEAKIYRDRARAAYDYTMIMECGFVRDQALADIRHGRLRSARERIEVAKDKLGGDSNQVAALLMTRARLSLREGKVVRAHFLFREAYRQWARLGANANQQFLASNQFWWLVALACLSDDPRLADFHEPKTGWPSLRRATWEELRTIEPSPTRKLLGWLLTYMPYLGRAIIALQERRA